jgi:hypothetical protein
MPDDSEQIFDESQHHHRTEEIETDFFKFTECDPENGSQFWEKAIIQ